jgi:hypothetical protein
VPLNGSTICKIKHSAIQHHYHEHGQPLALAHTHTRSRGHTHTRTHARTHKINNTLCTYIHIFNIMFKFEKKMIQSVFIIIWITHSILMFKICSSTPTGESFLHVLQCERINLRKNEKETIAGYFTSNDALFAGFNTKNFLRRFSQSVDI